MKERIKKWLTLFLTMIMVCTLMPTSMFAAEETEGTEETYETSETKTEEESEVYVYEYTDDDISITVTLDDAGDLPDEAELVVEEAEVTDEYLEKINAIRKEEYEELCEDIFQRGTTTTLLEYDEITEEDVILYNITFINDGEEIEPKDMVSVEIEYSEEKLEEIDAEAEDISIIHFTDEGEAETVESEEVNGIITFETDSFSDYASLTTRLGSSYGEISVFSDGSTAHYFQQYLVNSSGTSYTAFCLDLGGTMNSGYTASYVGTGPAYCGRAFNVSAK